MTTNNYAPKKTQVPGKRSPWPVSPLPPRWAWTASPSWRHDWPPRGSMRWPRLLLVHTSISPRRRVTRRSKPLHQPTGSCQNEKLLMDVSRSNEV